MTEPQRFLALPKEERKIPTLKMRILPEDFNDQGLVKGKIVYQLMKNSKQPLYKITQALQKKDLQISPAEFIQEAVNAGSYTAKDIEKMMLKAFKKTYPELMKTYQGAVIKQQIKRDTKRACIEFNKESN